MWLIETSGLIGRVLLVLSIYFVAKVVHMFMELRLEVAAPPEILQQCENLLKQKDFMGVYKLVKGDDSFFSTVLTAGLAELPQGLPEARDAMERVGETLVVEMERKISMLAVIGSLGPMIGLLGTLKGMIASFSGIAMSGTQLNASLVAGGISESLVLTFEGVILAVPAIYFLPCSATGSPRSARPPCWPPMNSSAAPTRFCEQNRKRKADKVRSRPETLIQR